MTSAMYKNGLNGTSDKSVRLMTNSEFTWNIPGNKIVSQDLKTNTRVWITDHSKATIKASKLYIVPDFIVHKKSKNWKRSFSSPYCILDFSASAYLPGWSICNRIIEYDGKLIIKRDDWKTKESFFSNHLSWIL